MSLLPKVHITWRPKIGRLQLNFVNGRFNGITWRRKR